MQQNNTHQKKESSNKEITSYLGRFRSKLSLFEAIALISSATIGAGIMGIPYAISKVGIPVGILYIIAIGLLMIGLNQLVGSTVLRTKERLQLVGLAGKYLGVFGEVLMTLFNYSIMFGALLVYIIGVGNSLAAMFGGSSFMWSLSFFVAAMTIIYIGLKTLKKVELMLILGILALVLLIAVAGASKVEMMNIQYTSLANLLFPYGVLLFAFHGTTSIPEAQRLLKNKNQTFKKAIIYSGLISILVYSIFAFIVVGITGAATTEVATIGLGQQLGPYMNIVGNLFAILTMGTSFLIIGLSLRDSLQWDYEISKKTATLLVGFIPLTVFLLGLREFVKAIDIVGGVFMSLEMSLLVFIYWKAKQVGDIEPDKYKLHHTLLFACLALIAFAVGAVYSLIKFF